MGLAVPRTLFQRRPSFRIGRPRSLPGLLPEGPHTVGLLDLPDLPVRLLELRETARHLGVAAPQDLDAAPELFQGGVELAQEDQARPVVVAPGGCFFDGAGPCVVRRLEGRVNVFQARTERDALIAQRLRDTAERLCGGSLTPLLTQLVSESELSEQDLTGLRALVDRLDAEREPRGSGG